MRLIDADEIKYTDMLSSKGNGNYEHVGIVTESEINALPTVDAVPVIHAHWEEDEYCYECSWCGMGSEVDYDYCPNCGAKMDEDEEE